jgi:hypothetical protein
MVEVVIGAVIAICITIAIENLRKPKLVLAIGIPVDNAYTGRPAQDVRFLLVKCENRPLPWFARWMSRNAALQCHGTVSFHHLTDGQNYFGRSMPIRWSGSSEPTPIEVHIGNARGVIIDPQRLSTESRVDIYPGEDWKLDVAARFDADAECYGWSNYSYFSNPVWRNPDWRLPAGRYLVKVTVISAGQRCELIFRLINDTQRRDFRLEPALPTDPLH